MTIQEKVWVAKSEYNIKKPKVHKTVCYHTNQCGGIRDYPHKFIQVPFNTLSSHGKKKQRNWIKCKRCPAHSPTTKLPISSFVSAMKASHTNTSTDSNINICQEIDIISHFTKLIRTNDSSHIKDVNSFLSKKGYVIAQV